MTAVRDNSRKRRGPDGSGLGDAARRVVAHSWILAVPLLSLPYAFYRMYDRFSGWDDEGALLVSVSQMMKGRRLFDDVFVGYGPVYFDWECSVRSLLGLA